jgi:hypothetical protein
MKKYSSVVPGHVIRRFNRWLMAGLLFIVFIILVVAVSLVLWFLNLRSDESGQPTSRGETTINDPFKTFKTDYFTFKTDKTWQFVPEESSANTFVYRSIKKGLVQRDLTVYVNNLPSNLLLTAVLSADAGKNSFKIRQMSGHCRKALPDNYLKTTRNPAEVTIDGVSFTCQADNDQTIIGTGLSGNGLSTVLNRGNGATAGYLLLYHDLEFTPKPSIFRDIVEGFKSR